MVREEQLLKRIQELETENEKLRTQLNRRTSGAVDGAAEQTRAKYADRILDTLPDMMTVWTNSGVITDLISSEETNHVGVPSERFIGMNIRELLPEEAYRNVRANLDHVLETKRGSTGRHDLTVDGELRHYENRIWPLDLDKVLCMCRDITEAVRTQKAMNDANKRMKLIEQVVSLGYWFYYSKTNEFYAPDILPVLLERESGADSVMPTTISSISSIRTTVKKRASCCIIIRSWEKKITSSFGSLPTTKSNTCVTGFFGSPSKKDIASSKGTCKT